MKVIRDLIGEPIGASLSINVQYGVADIKSALLKICGNRMEITIKELIRGFFDAATDSHMPQEARRYISEWMARRAIKEGFVFRANKYLGEVDADSDVYLIDETVIKERMRGRPKKAKREEYAG